jgi:hypothetical protein
MSYHSFIPFFNQSTYFIFFSLSSPIFYTPFLIFYSILPILISKYPINYSVLKNKSNSTHYIISIAIKLPYSNTNRIYLFNTFYIIIYNWQSPSSSYFTPANTEYFFINNYPHPLLLYNIQINIQSFKSNFKHQSLPQLITKSLQTENSNYRQSILSYIFLS